MNLSGYGEKDINRESPPSRFDFDSANSVEILLYLSNFGRFEAFLWSLSVQEPYVSGVIELGV